MRTLNKSLVIGNVVHNVIVLSKKDEAVTPEDVASAAAASDDELPF